jgi:AcrR family transcriptional regulator
MSGKNRRHGDIDRRVRRTRDALQKALISLILDKGYEALTIEEICDAANVGRSTFYAHYTSKDDLKRSAIDEHLRSLFQQSRDAHSSGADGRQPVSPTLAILGHAREHRDYCRAVVRGDSAALAVETIRKALADHIRQEIRELDVDGSSGAFLREFSVQYVVGAFMSVLSWWIQSGAKRPPEEVEDLFRRFTARGTDAVLGTTR